MHQRSVLPFGRPCFLVLIQLTVLISPSLVCGSQSGLTQSELKAKYGQADTNFNDGKSCYRDCDGEIKTCYYEFNVQLYDTMTGLCGRCTNGTIDDCFNEGCITANGVERVIMTVNQQLPGSAINVCKDDRIIVDVTNQMDGEGLTIHWHGLHQRETPWYDGVPMVTQCPINAGNTFRYVFKATEAGTLFYHAHSGLHRSNGVLGKFVVRDPNEPHADAYDYDLAEHSILLIDWGNDLAEESAPGRRSVQTQPHSILINGFGNYFNANTGDRKYAPIAAFYVERGKKHRFRFANAASHPCASEITIKDHKLTVIATDGSPIEPIVVGSLVILPGERYDIVMDAATRSETTETILTIRGVTACRAMKLQEFARIIFVDNIRNHATKLEDHKPLKEVPSYESLDYPKTTLNHPITDCTTSDNYCVPHLRQKHTMATENLRNVSAKVIPLRVQMVKIQRRRHNYLIHRDMAEVSLINRISHAHPPMPPLIQDDSNIGYCKADKMPENCDTAKDGKPVAYCTHMIDLKLGEVYEFLATDDESATNSFHPIHLHGHSFQVIDMGSRVQLDSGTTVFENATHFPVIKDTVVIPSDGFVRIRFRASNPGYWIIHCHFEYHMHVGMGLILKVGSRNDMLKPPQNFPTCGHYLESIDEM